MFLVVLWGFGSGLVTTTWEGLVVSVTVVDILGSLPASLSICG